MKAPSCCEGKPQPCCNTSCIDRIALRECVSDKNPGHASSDQLLQKERTACRQHISSAWSKYKAQLETLGCLCRTLLARNEESCCAPLPTSTMTDGCCVSDSAPLVICKEDEKEEANTCTDACCGKDPSLNISSNNINASKDIVSVNPASCADSCCAKTPVSSKEVQLQVTSVSDPERGLSSGEHVILSISGMTCTGCETKLSRTLAAIPTITNLQTSLVLARAEFDLNAGAMSTSDVLAYLERTTEFKCERIETQGSSLGFISTGDPAEFINMKWPEGVTDIKPAGKKMFKVNFDASIIGARDLTESWPEARLAPHRADPTVDTGAKHVRRVGCMTLLSAVLTIPVLVLGWAPLPNKEEKRITFGSVSLALTTIIQFVIAGPFYPNALKALIFSKVIEMDLLIVLSTSVAYIFSVVAFGYMVAHKPLSTGEFFETSALLVTLIMVGRYLAALARQKAIESISIRSLQSSTATILEKGVEREIDTRLLQYGDIFKVFPDTKIATDGTVIAGSSEVNESMVTGESRPVEKSKGSPVIAGSINGPGALTVRLTRVPNDNTISAIARMVDEARLSKPRIQGIADKVASYFVPVVIALSIAVFCIWVAVGIAVQNKAGSEAVIQAITYAITVLIVSCPCAIGLAVPMVIVVACGVAAKMGVIFKSAGAIEVAHKVTHVVFDKTGTLTRGELNVVREQYLDDSPETKSLLLGLVKESKHPVAVAVTTHLVENKIRPTDVIGAQNVVGKGIEASFGGNTLRAGNPRWLNISEDTVIHSFLSEGHTPLCFTINGSLAAVFGLQDSLREDSLSTLDKLRQKGISLHILSGDEDGAVRAVAEKLSIPDTNLRSRCSPADKQVYIKTLVSPPVSNCGNKIVQPIVMFCGDGTNDAAALAQATIGVHMNEGTDVAGSAADLVLMRPSLAGVLVAINISSKAMHRITFNFGWSFVYNLLAVLLASGAFVRARIPPEFAGLGELVSVLPVVAAGVLLKWAKI
ncbi:copper-translocating P-t [Periconia macrospinosa]|uniref:Copper-translocating P-t n=1 Tax=Periconia macrospinosa TaxID=97972 RepID=A0A2V1E1Q6_9PLEO|nr:copper-translocating P-t [Periconia macrospinosa]